MFEGLAEAVRYCHDGPNSPHPSEQGSWDTVVHRDITLTNIFLSSSQASDTHYSTIKLGDYDCAVPLSDLTTSRPIKTDLSREDPAYVPPEGPVARPKCDIFQIGLVMVCLSYGFVEPNDVRQEEAELSRARKYSNELHQSIRVCTKEKYGKRPSARILGTRIRAAKEKMEGEGRFPPYESLL
ncbi:hypothetical protein K458DRAFT_400904 [Lentithecium fluviatile CBS 122367]|uniref:EKC/KEOPS complex subunit BUD32 n=1 Tax=Lentithecium fluviatile CBS 122367 TaxID=1168545 RepID=A0A6G1JF77_9PLEO|nr:hypothetical protein K458DRAFT_400904 [Lentithecium fluviatile CBS 122367]